MLILVNQNYRELYKRIILLMICKENVADLVFPTLVSCKQVNKSCKQI